MKLRMRPLLLCGSLIIVLLVYTVLFSVHELRAEFENSQSRVRRSSYNDFIIKDDTGAELRDAAEMNNFDDNGIVSVAQHNEIFADINQLNLRVRGDRFPIDLPYLALPSMIKSEWPSPIKEEDRRTLAAMLKRFSTVADSLNITWIIYAGTLLGSWRHHGMIPWDENVNVLVNITAKEVLFEALKTRLVPENEVAMVNNNLRLTSVKKSRPVSEDLQIKWPFLMISFFDQNETHFWDNHPRYSHKKFALSNLLPLHGRPFYKRWCNAPHKPLEILKTMYAGSLHSCVSPSFSQKYQTRMQPMTIACADLKTRYPFVHRKFVDNRMVEKLCIGELTLHRLIVQESSGSVTDPFTLHSLS